jgi:hypothetical protein
MQSVRKPDRRWPARASRAGTLLPALLLCILPLVTQAMEAPIGIRENPRAAATGISVDQAIEIAERRYRARVVRAESKEQQGRRVYVLRLLSEEGRVWTVRVDAETGSVN